MKKIALLISLIVSLTYASDGYRASLDMISRLGKCEALEKVNFRAKDSYVFIAAKSKCENGYINIAGPSLYISITFSPDSESIKHSTMNLSKSRYSGGTFLNSYADVLLCDEYGIMERFDMEISDSEVDSIYRLIKNFGKSEKGDDYEDEDEEKIAQIMAKYN